MTPNCKQITLGYDLDSWNLFGEMEEINVDISEKNNSHIMLTGASGSGKSYAENRLLAELILAEPESLIYFADFKFDDDFSHLRTCKKYYGYEKALEAMNLVYETMHRRQSLEEMERRRVTLFFDEYVANILAIQNVDSKKANKEKAKMSELLMLSRSMNIRIVTTCQRPDASVFPNGARMNCAINMILGSADRTTYEMLMPEYIDQIKGRTFGIGEGVVLLHGSVLRFIKIPTVRDEARMKAICVEALSK